MPSPLVVITDHFTLRAAPSVLVRWVSMLKHCSSNCHFQSNASP